VGNLWHDKSFGRVRNLTANLKCVVFVITSPGIPYQIHRRSVEYIQQFPIPTFYATFFLQTTAYVGVIC